MPSRPISVTTSATTPDAANRRAQLDQIDAAALDPAPDRDLLAPCVEPDRDPARVIAAQLVDQLGVLDRGGADHHAPHARGEQCARGVDAAHSPADLHRARHRGRDRRDRRQVRRLTGARRVEVDHVDPPRAVGLEPARDRDRIRVVDGLGREVAPQQPHRVAAPQVDRGEEVYSVPFVDGSSAPSIRTASRRQRATPLKDASMTW